MSMNVRLGTQAANGTELPLQHGTGISVNTDKYQAKSMSLIPSGVNFKGDVETKALKAVFFGLASPLLLPFMAGYAISAAACNAVNKAEVMVRNDLSEKKANLTAELSEKKAQLSQARELLADHDELHMDIRNKIINPKDNLERVPESQLKLAENHLLVAMENARSLTIPNLKVEIARLEKKLEKLETRLQPHDTSFDKSLGIHKHL